MGAGKTVSVRMPEGSVEELRAATGMDFSTLCRMVMLSVLERYRRERKLKEGTKLKQQVQSTVTEETNKLLDGDGAL